MKHNENPLFLSQICLNAYAEGDKVTNQVPGTEQFDGRHDFVMGPGQSALAVRMVLANSRACDIGDTPGIRRAVAVTIVDETAGCAMGSATVRVSIPRGSVTAIRRADIPFHYRDIDPSHTYRVVVRDEACKKVIGGTFLRMYDEALCGRHPSEWYEAERGCLADSDTGKEYKAFAAHTMDLYDVRFHLVTHFVEEPFILPEVEVRIHFPDGSVESGFRALVCDDYDMGEYHVEAPVCFNREGMMGVCYAEAICMDYVFAGFAFSTDSFLTRGHWSGRQLEPLDEYTPEAAEERFRAAMDEADGSDGGLDAEDFDRLLDDFIASEKRECGIGDEEEETDGSEDVEPGEEQEEDPEAGKECDAEPGAEEPGEPDTADDGRPPLALLDHLTGLTSVKRKLETYEKVVRFNRLRRDCGLPVPGAPLHAMFLGSPGTGKTTVARMMGLMLRRAGVLSKGHVVVRERSTLIGRYYSMEETNTREAIEEAQGGILFIDEAYQLCQPDDPKDPGRFVIEALMTALADESRRDWMLILAGYPEEMRRMFGMNPGLRSRIPESNIYTFDDFTEPELMEIAERYLGRNRYTLSPEARGALSLRLAADYAQRDRTFGNARHVVNMIQTEILPAMAVRVVEEGPADERALCEIQAADIPQPSAGAALPRPRIGFCA